MGDNWAFVAAAYGLGLIVLGGYWRRLVRKERLVFTLAARSDRGGARDRGAPGRQPAVTAHARPEPAKREPLS